MSRYSYKYAAGMLQARFDKRRLISALIRRLQASSETTVPEPRLVKRLLDEKNVPSDIFAVLEPYLWDCWGYELTYVMREYTAMEEMSKHRIPIDYLHHIEVTSILRNIILVALDEENVEVFTYLLRTTSAVWDPMWEDEIGFKDFRSLDDSSQFAPLLANLVCYRGKVGDSRYMGPTLRSYSSCQGRATYTSMSSGSRAIQDIKTTIIEGNYVTWNYGGLLKAAMSGDRAPDIIIFLAGLVDWPCAVSGFLIKKRAVDARAITALEATMRKIATTQIARWHGNSVRFLVKRVKWPGDRVRFLEKALLKTVQPEDLNPSNMAFLEELFC
jgi:hypothetical protein